MIACRNCGSRMVFDIPSQKMKCIHCGGTEDVETAEENIHHAETESTYTWDYDKNDESEETGLSGEVDNSTFETKIYKCSQCGAELMTQDESAVSFCQFCGAQSVLEGEFERVSKPDHIIPFKLTKQACKDIYKKKMRFALYAPGEMKKNDHIDEFRGIYMPYFVYDVEQNGPIRLTGKRSYRRGDYIITEHYDLMGDIHGRYPGITHDASSNFADNISECIAPYDMAQKKEFKEGYLHGFYGDISDVDADIYRPQATGMANEYALHEAKKIPEFSRVSIEQTKNDPNLSSRFNTGVREIRSSMMPVWFLSIKRHGRMSFATINGQTGRMYADIPIEPWKFILGSLITTVPLFFLLQMLFTIKPQTLVYICTLLELLVLMLYKHQVKSIIDKSSAIIYGDPRYVKKKKISESGRNAIATAGIVALFLLYSTRGKILSLLIGYGNEDLIGKIIISVIAAAGLIYMFLAQNQMKDAFEINDRFGNIVSVIVFLAATLVVWIAPVDDMWYYIVCFVSVFAILVSLISLIRSYNVLSSRQPRTFVRKGGDDLGI